MKLLDYVNNVTKKPALCEHAKTKAQISALYSFRKGLSLIFFSFDLNVCQRFASIFQTLAYVGQNVVV